MCGRTGLSLNKEDVQCACSYKPRDGKTFVKPDWLPEHNDGKDFIPSLNIAPTDVMPILISTTKFQHSAKTTRALKPMMWGIIPPWHKGNYRNHSLSTNNCRVENIKSSKLYGPILSSGGRCIVVAEGFYEWQTTVRSKVKEPYYIYTPQDAKVRVDDPNTWNNEFREEDGWKGIKLLYMAGLYNVWQNGGTIIYSFSIITMDSNNTLDWLHHRMPAILDDQHQIEAWLDVDNVNPDMALSYLKPVKILSWHQVSTIVNNSRNKSIYCNIRLTKEDKAAQKTLNAYFKHIRKSSEENTHMYYKRTKY